MHLSGVHCIINFREREREINPDRCFAFGHCHYFAVYRLFYSHVRASGHVGYELRTLWVRVRVRSYGYGYERSALLAEIL